MDIDNNLHELFRYINEQKEPITGNTSYVISIV